MLSTLSTLETEDKITLTGCVISFFLFLFFAFFGVIPEAKAEGIFGASSVPEVQGRTPLDVKFGIVMDVQDVQIEVKASKESRGLGGVLGGILGGTLANRINKNVITKGVAVTLGAIAGERIANNVGTEMREAEQVIIRLENKTMIAIVQESAGVPLVIGDVVYLVGKSPARIVKSEKFGNVKAYLE